MVSGCTDLRPPLNITVICSFESTTFAEQKCCSKKKDTPTGVFLFGAGDEARWRPCRAATRTRAPKHATGMFFSLRSCPFEPLPDLTKKETTILTDGGFLFGAGDEARTRYLDLGKVALYQMSYARTTMVIIRHRRAVVKPFFCFCRFFHRYGRCKTQKPPPGTVTVSIT